MIEIKKGREPDKLLRYRQQVGASYEQMDKEVEDEYADLRSQIATSNTETEEINN